MHRLRLALISAVATMMAGPAAAAEQGIRFDDVTEQAGLIQPLLGIMGHGAAFGDYDGDGDIDLFVGGFCDRPADQYVPARMPVPARLLRNLGDGTFELVGRSAASFFGRTSGAVFADLDNDGLLDLYVANNSKGKSSRDTEPQRAAQLRNVNLFANRSGRFVDVSDQSGACPAGFRTARNIGVFDYDGDGLLDLFVVGDRFTRQPRSVLFRNLGDLTFRDVNREAGLPDDIFGLGLAVADLNGDRRPDFFVPHANRMFVSRGDGTYRESAQLNRTFAWKPLDGEDWPCGAAFGDLDRDGDLDLVLSVHSVRARNRVYLNEGPRNGLPRFRDVTDRVGLGETVPARCPHVEIQDFDNDGWPDIYMSAAWRNEAGRVIPLIYRHRGLRAGLPHFEPIREIGAPMIYYPAGPSGDVDGDGRIDLFLVNWFRQDHCRLLRNTSPPRHWLNVRVRGRSINRMGIGSLIQVHRAAEAGEADALLGTIEIATGYGYASGQPAVAHFGLGDVRRVDLQVMLPSGKTLTFKNVAADQTLTVEEPR